MIPPCGRAAGSRLGGRRDGWWADGRGQSILAVARPAWNCEASEWSRVECPTRAELAYVEQLRARPRDEIFGAPSMSALEQDQVSAVRVRGSAEAQGADRPPGRTQQGRARPGRCRSATEAKPPGASHAAEVAERKPDAHEASRRASRPSSRNAGHFEAATVETSRPLSRSAPACFQGPPPMAVEDRDGQPMTTSSCADAAAGEGEGRRRQTPRRRPTANPPRPAMPPRPTAAQSAP